jgi:zinc transport system ATP-binding protein
MDYTLEAFLDGELIFHSSGKWLHPLFELENFLKQQNYDPASLIVKDKIVGRAAALVQVYLGVKTVQAGMMSKLGKEIFNHFQINYKYENMVDRIQCRTEEILKGEFDPEKAYLVIKAIAEK